uniref:Uncharacterized protein n=1 Tax=Quercus lobata TaxID=97700 RepID=A0A7N2MXX2_QUELO
MDSSLFNGGNYYEIKVLGTGIPKWFKFNHQSDGNSVSFRIGHEFPKAIVCIAFQSVEAHKGGSFSVYVSVNGCKEKLSFQDIGEMSWHLWLFSVSNLKLLDSSPYEENDIENSDSKDEEETIDQHMAYITKNRTSLALDGFESDFDLMALNPISTLETELQTLEMELSSNPFDGSGS